MLLIPRNRGDANAKPLLLLLKGDRAYLVYRNEYYAVVRVCSIDEVANLLLKQFEFGFSIETSPYIINSPYSLLLG